MQLTSTDPLTYRLWILAQRLVALALLVLLTPLLAVLFVLVKLTSRGPFLFCQLRPGHGGTRIWVWKIRTMRAGSDKNLSLGLGVTKNNLEVTRIGHLLRELKLDELPQLWNIVRGEMRIVGPRPIAPVLHDRLCQSIPAFEQRLLVPPGLTNVGQVAIYENKVNQHLEDDWRMRFESDEHYLRHRSVSYDLVLVCLTILYLMKKVWRKATSIFPGRAGARTQSRVNIPRVVLRKWPTGIS